MNIFNFLLIIGRKFVIIPREIITFDNVNQTKTELIYQNLSREDKNQLGIQIFILFY
jgi:hypothetical protein